MTARGLITIPSLAPLTRAGQTIPAGRWCLHTTSTVPWVEIQDSRHTRVITWGEVIEIESQGAVINRSWHTGDVQLAPVFDASPALRPSGYFLPAYFHTEGRAAEELVSDWLDVRNARRAYLALNIPDTNSLFLPVTLEHQTQSQPGAPGISRTVSPASVSYLAAGVITEIRTINTVRRYSLGFQARDVAPGDPTPHTLFAAVRVRFASSTLAAGFDPTFSVEF